MVPLPSRKQKAAVMRDGDADRPSPDFAIVDDEARGKILVFAGRRAILHADADRLCIRALGPIPGAVLGGEGVAAISGGN